MAALVVRCFILHTAQIMSHDLGTVQQLVRNLGRASEGYHDAGHEEAARSAQASVDDHEQQVGRAQDDE